MTTHAESPEPPEPSDEELLCAHRGGDPRAYRRLYERYHVAILQFGLYKLGSLSDAEDVAQQTFLNLHRFAHSYRPGSRFRAWLFAIAHNAIRELYRRRGRRPELLSDRMDEGPTCSPPTQEAALERRELDQALTCLPQGQRHLVGLRMVAGCSYREISSITGVRPAALRVRMHRSLGRLRERLPEVVAG